eukprot:gene35752-58753_t
MRWRLLPLIDETGAVEALVAAAERIEAEVPVEAVIPSAPEDASVTPAQPAGDPALTEALARAWDDLRTARAEADALREAAAQAESDARGELEAARRLESVGRLTGGVSQDFSALLGVMTSALDMILKQADEPDRVRRLGRAALAAGPFTQWVDHVRRFGLRPSPPSRAPSVKTESSTVNFRMNLDHARKIESVQHN